MNVIIKRNTYNLSETNFFGREGDIYTVDQMPEKLVKIYVQEKCTSYTERKVTAIINRFRNLDLRGIEKYIAFPEVPVYRAANQHFCGFLMKNFCNCSKLLNNRFDLKTFKYKEQIINDSKAVSIIEMLFSYLELLHRMGFVLGDVNPENILIDKNKYMPYIVDIDSVQLGTYYSNTKREQYIDPQVRVDGFGRKKYFIYNTDSDIYALTVVCYEFIIGIHPYFFQTTEPTDTEFKKKKSLSFLDYFENNISKTRSYDFKVFTNPASQLAEKRLNEIKEKYPALFEYFCNTFLSGNRSYFGNNKLEINPSGLKEDSNSFISELLPQSKSDPDELELFLEQFKIELF